MDSVVNSLILHLSIYIKNPLMAYLTVIYNQFLISLFPHQIHVLESGDVRIYSRNQEDNTSKYPDIINRISKSFGGDVKSCVIDSESVAYDLEKKQIQPFQVLSTRKRKDANEAEIKVQVCVFAFDLLYLNGEVRHGVVKTGVGNPVISSGQFWICQLNFALQGYTTQKS